MGAPSVMTTLGKLAGQNFATVLSWQDYYNKGQNQHW